MCQVDYWLQVASWWSKIGRVFFRIRNFGRKNGNEILRSEPERHKSELTIWSLLTTKGTKEIWILPNRDIEFITEKYFTMCLCGLKVRMNHKRHKRSLDFSPHRYIVFIVLNKGIFDTNIEYIADV